MYCILIWRYVMQTFVVRTEDESKHKENKGYRGREKRKKANVK